MQPREETIMAISPIQHRRDGKPPGAEIARLTLFFLHFGHVSLISFAPQRSHRAPCKDDSVAYLAQIQIMRESRISHRGSSDPDDETCSID
jgi:hypothetical protein